MGEPTPPVSKYRPPKPDEPALHRAARLGDNAEIGRIVGAGTPVDGLFNIRLDPGAREQPATALMVAAGSADGATVETVRVLLDLGAAIGPGPDGQTPLSYACCGLGLGYAAGGDAARLAALLEAGSDPNSVGYIGEPALAEAAHSGDVARVRLLLDAGASVTNAASPEIVARFRGTPCNFLALHRAAESGSGACVRLLLAAGAPVVGDGADHSVLACATSAEIVSVLLDAGADPRAPRRRYPLAHDIASNKRVAVPERVAMLRALTAAGVDISAPDDRGSTALSDLAMIRNDDGVEALLRAGADPFVGHSPMASACFAWSGNHDPATERVIDLLVDAGFDPHDRDHHGHGPLHQALSPDAYGDGYLESDGINVAAAAALLRNGASLDIVFENFDGAKPLHVAALERNAHAIELLLAAGADPGHRNYSGERPIEVARRMLCDGRENRERAQACIDTLQRAMDS